MKNIFLLFLMILAVPAMADDLTATITPSSPGLNNGAINLNIDGGVSPYSFQWTGPGGYSSSGEDIAGLAAGEYCVTVADFYCGTATLCVVVEEELASGMVTPDVSSFTVFPNPFSGEFSIVLESPARNEYTFALYDLEGKMVWAEKKILESGINSTHFILSGDIVAGRYEIIMKDNKDRILSSSVVRIR